MQHASNSDGQEGVLVDEEILQLVLNGSISVGPGLGPRQLQPSSLDLRLGRRIWQLQCSFLPGRRGLAGQLERLAISEMELKADQPCILHCGGVYLAEVTERLRLPPDVSGRVNPKSSTGRLDVFVRLLTESGESFDTIPEGYSGRIFLEIAPQSFHIMVRQGDTLAQLRLLRGSPVMSDVEVADLHAQTPLLLNERGQPLDLTDGALDRGVLLSVDLTHASGGTIGYQAMSHRPPVDLARRDYEPARFWNRLRSAQDEGHVLEPERFYIFATCEYLRIPPDVCAELVPFDPTRGELRTHYAGFVDSGFGWTPSSPTGDLPDDAAVPTLIHQEGPISSGPSLGGAKLVLEIRTHDVPFLLEHGLRLFRLEFWKNTRPPRSLYGGALGSHYQGQGLRLAKQFGQTERPVDQSQLKLFDGFSE